MVTIHFDNASDHQQIPSEEDTIQWTTATLRKIEKNEDSELSIRVVNTDESHALNLQYRHKDKPTNVLSFPCELPSEVDIPLLGDIVVCAAIVESEALEQAKNITAHWAHMIVHGTLHLCGYDHISDDDAEHMESLEISILGELGFANPYEVDTPESTHINQPL